MELVRTALAAGPRVDEATVDHVAVVELPVLLVGHRTGVRTLEVTRVIPSPVVLAVADLAAGVVHSIGQD